jgi:hypothetical protein
VARVSNAKSDDFEQSVVMGECRRLSSSLCDARSVDVCQLCESVTSDAQLQVKPNIKEGYKPGKQKNVAEE